MTQLIADLLHRIDNIADGTDEDQLTRIITAWRGDSESEKIRRALLEWLEAYANIDALKAMARETSTHYVWPIHLNEKGYGVAINEFKDPREIKVGYATTLHNHRYSFVSVVLSGGYGQVRSTVELLGPGLAAQLCDVSEDVITDGDIVTINHEEFHRLRTINACTVTLVVKCPAVKDESLSVDTGTLRVTTHAPVESRIGQLMDALAH